MTSPFRIVLVTGFVVAAAVVLWLTTKGPPEATAGRAPDLVPSQASAAPERGRQGTLLENAVLAKLEEMNGRLVALESKAQRPRPSVPPKLEEAPPPSAEETHRRNLGLVAALDEDLRTEHVDDDWAPATERRLADRLRETPPAGSTVLEAPECRATYCRLVVSHENWDSEEAFVEFVGSDPLGSLTVPKHRLDQERSAPRETVAYLIRDGHDSAEHAVRAHANPSPLAAGTH